ncbi:MAG: flagellar motor stator protein MotA [Alphaproteobacteria bacterium]|nr:flagellar motor stator protein MotA [Alphaproteobacteria bacterium]
MFVIIGVVVVIGSVIGGYIPHGDLAVLWQPFEVLIICGAALGAFLIGNPKTVIMATFKSPGRLLKGPPHNKAAYLELLILLFQIFRLAKTKGMLALETHLENPAGSPLFQPFSRFLKNKHAVSFMCDYLRLITMGTESPHELEALMDEDIETHHAEMAEIGAAINRVGNGLPAFGIVAAVLGVIVTMGSITEPPEVLGALIGGALVGTFLGVLIAYGFVPPSGANLTKWTDADTKYFLCIKAGLLAHLHGYAPAVSIEFARKTLFSHERPSFTELEQAVQNAATA